MKRIAVAGPSLALVKYWGKKDEGINLPLCTSVAITLDSLQSRVSIEDSQKDHDSCTLNGQDASLDSLRGILATLREQASPEKKQQFVHIEAENNFPTGAGLASSASGLAACALALVDFFGLSFTTRQLSSLARLGSGSACRSIFSGFTLWREGKEYAEQLAPPTHWEELRMIVCVVSDKKKEISSRLAMQSCKEFSPFFSQWIRYNNTLVADAVSAIHSRDLEKLGHCMQASYSAMHATMIANKYPIRYWLPQSLVLIKHAEYLRSKNIPVWETMDAGPQVKYLTKEQHVDAVLSSIQDVAPKTQSIVCKISDGVRFQ